MIHAHFYYPADISIHRQHDSGRTAFCLLLDLPDIDHTAQLNIPTDNEIYQSQWKAVTVRALA